MTVQKSRGSSTEVISTVIGTSTVTITDLDLAKAEDNPTTLILRLTLDGSDARLYTHEIINDDDVSVIRALQPLLRPR